MIRILVVFTTAFVRTGGLASVMMNYWRALEREGLSFDFASSNDADAMLVEEIAKEGSKYYQLPKRKDVWSYYKALKKLCFGYDIVHVHANSATSVIELMAAKKAGVKRRIHHNHTSKTQHPYLNTLLHPLFSRSYTDAVAVSKEAGDWLFGQGNYQILPNAIDVDKFKFNTVARKKIRDEFGIAENEYVVGHIGKFMDAKNHEFLIKVFAAYHTEHPDSKLLLVGDGAWRPKIEKWISKSGCTDAIILAGMRSDIPDVVQAFDVFLFPSVYEGLPLTVLEAQSSGLPCLVSDNVTDAVKVGFDCFSLSLKNDAEVWATYIDTLPEKISRQERCVKSRELITEAGFNIKYEASKLKDLYERR